MRIDEQIGIMQKFSNGKTIQQRTIRSLGDWQDVRTPSWNWDKNEYRERPREEIIKTTSFKKSNRIKDFSDYRIFSLKKTKKGLPILSKSLFDLLKNDANLVMKVYIESMKYSSLDLEQTVCLNSNNTQVMNSFLNSDDLNSMRMINTFLRKISSGIRSPSDRDKAKEMNDYLSNIIFRLSKIERTFNNEK